MFLIRYLDLPFFCLFVLSWSSGLLMLEFLPVVTDSKGSNRASFISLTMNLTSSYIAPSREGPIKCSFRNARQNTTRNPFKGWTGAFWLTRVGETSAFNPTLSSAVADRDNKCCLLWLIYSFCIFFYHIVCGILSSMQFEPVKLW